MYSEPRRITLASVATSNISRPLAPSPVHGGEKRTKGANRLQYLCWKASTATTPVALQPGPVWPDFDCVGHSNNHLVCGYGRCLRQPHSTRQLGHLPLQRPSQDAISVNTTVALPHRACHTNPPSPNATKNAQCDRASANEHPVASTTQLSSVPSLKFAQKH